MARTGPTGTTGAGAALSGAAGGRGEQFKGVGLADGGAELFGVLKRLQFRLLVGGEEAGGLFPELGVGGIKLFTNGGDFEDRFADSGSIRTAVGDGGLQGLLFGVGLIGEGAVGGARRAVGGSDGRHLGVGEVEVRFQFREGGGTRRGLGEADGSSEQGESERGFHFEFLCLFEWAADNSQPLQG